MAYSKNWFSASLIGSKAFTDVKAISYAGFTYFDSLFFATSGLLQVHKAMTSKRHNLYYGLMGTTELLLSTVLALSQTIIPLYRFGLVKGAFATVCLPLTIIDITIFYLLDFAQSIVSFVKAAKKFSDSDYLFRDRLAKHDIISNNIIEKQAQLTMLTKSATNENKISRLQLKKDINQLKQQQKRLQQQLLAIYRCKKPNCSKKTKSKFLNKKFVKDLKITEWEKQPAPTALDEKTMVYLENKVEKKLNHNTLKTVERGLMALSATCFVAAFINPVFAIPAIVLFGAGSIFTVKRAGSAVQTFIKANKATKKETEVLLENTEIDTNQQMIKALYNEILEYNTNNGNQKKLALGDEAVKRLLVTAKADGITEGRANNYFSYLFSRPEKAIRKHLDSTLERKAKQSIIAKKLAIDESDVCDVVSESDYNRVICSK